MNKIKLTKGKYVLVDDSDFEWLNQWKWHFMNVGYAGRDEWVNRRNEKILMHRQIMGLEKGDARLVDHINQDTLDNRRSNLRLADRSLNAFNSKLSLRNTSGHRGVSFDKLRIKWKASIQIHGKQYYLGRFNDFESAVSAVENKYVKV